MRENIVSEEHLSGYQARDFEVVDYKMYCLDDTGLWFRGPAISSLDMSDYIVCIGAAQTFGCFCEKPFPILLQETLNIPVLNLGYGGAGPYFYLKHSKLLRYLNQAKLVIVQVMSGRSENNSMFESGGLELLTRRNDGVKIGSNEAYSQALNGLKFLPPSMADKWLPRKIARVFGRMETKKIVMETRQNWMQNYKTLLSQIKTPKLLFWFSKRQPQYKDRYSSVNSLFNEFPQLVNLSMIQQIQTYSDEYIECVSSAGSPQPLFSRFSGKPTTVNPADDRQDLGGKLWTHNMYYPSPQMHLEAAKLLSVSCQKYV